MSLLYIVELQPSGRPVSDGVRDMVVSREAGERAVRRYQESTDSVRYVLLTRSEHRDLLDRFHITSDPATWRYDKGQT